MTVMESEPTCGSGCYCCSCSFLLELLRRQGGQRWRYHRWGSQVMSITLRYAGLPQETVRSSHNKFKPHQPLPAPPYARTPVWHLPGPAMDRDWGWRCLGFGRHRGHTIASERASTRSGRRSFISALPSLSRCLEKRPPTHAASAEFYSGIYQLSRVYERQKSATCGLCATFSMVWIRR